MDVINYFIDHSWEILRLSTAFVFVAVGVFCFQLCPVVYQAHKLVKKINTLIDEFNVYIRKPVTYALTAYKILKKVTHLFGLDEKEDKE